MPFYRHPTFRNGSTLGYRIDNDGVVCYGPHHPQKGQPANIKDDAEKQQLANWGCVQFEPDQAPANKPDGQKQPKDKAPEPPSAPDEEDGESDGGGEEDGEDADDADEQPMPNEGTKGYSVVKAFDEAEEVDIEAIADAADCTIKYALGVLKEYRNWTPEDDEDDESSEEDE